MKTGRMTMPQYIIEFNLGNTPAGTNLSKEWVFVAKDKEEAEVKAERMAERFRSINGIATCEVVRILGPKHEIRLN